MYFVTLFIYVSYDCVNNHYIPTQLLCIRRENENIFIWSRRASICSHNLNFQCSLCVYAIQVTINNSTGLGRLASNNTPDGPTVFLLFETNFEMV